MVRITIAFLLIFSMMGIFQGPLLSSEGAGTTGTDTEAVVAALVFLTLVDEGRYDASWDEAAGFFKNAVSREQWIKSAGTVRGPLGKVVSRRLKSRKHLTSVPGAPDGEYIVIQFDTSFENKKTAVETVTPMLDSDGEWRATGYYIR